jgi:hypothetical protein
VWNSVGELSVCSLELVPLQSKRGPVRALRKDASALPYSEQDNNNLITLHLPRSLRLQATSVALTDA